MVVKLFTQILSAIVSEKVSILLKITQKSVQYGKIAFMCFIDLTKIFYNVNHLQRQQSNKFIHILVNNYHKKYECQQILDKVIFFKKKEKQTQENIWNFKSSICTTRAYIWSPNKEFMRHASNSSSTIHSQDSLTQEKPEQTKRRPSSHLMRSGKTCGKPDQRINLIMNID